MHEVECKARITQGVLAEVYRQTGELKVPVNVSNRHIHLDNDALVSLFGADHPLTRKKDLIQLGQFACEETVTLKGPKGSLKGVRVLGPLRGATQIEISKTDSFVLGVKPVIRMSGNVAGTPGITVEGPKGSIDLPCGVIVAERHLHVPTSLSETLGLKNGETVSLVTKGERPTVLMHVAVRVSDMALLEAHVDVDEANAAGIVNGMFCDVIKECVETK